MTPAAPNQLLTAADVARLIDRTPACVRDLARRGVLIPTATTPSGTRLFTRVAVDAYLETRAQRHSRAA